MSGQRFPRAARLLQPAQFDPVLRTGSRHHSALFRAHVLANGQDGARLGITVAKRNVSLSVQRNRLRRHIRELYRAKRPELTGFDIVVIAKAGCATHENARLRQDLSQLFVTIAALKRAPPPGTIAP
jgi:ribonuclease P protein component